MRQTDLEMHRWCFHNFVKQNSHLSSNHLGWRMYWKEVGAFVSMLPRQSGKTTMIIRMIQHVVESEFPDYIVLVRDRSMANNMIQHNVLSNNILTALDGHNLAGKDTSNTNLFVDEFMFIPGSILNKILDRAWKSVTMVSSLR